MALCNPVVKLLPIHVSIPSKRGHIGNKGEIMGTLGLDPGGLLA